MFDIIGVKLPIKYDRGIKFIPLANICAGEALNGHRPHFCLEHSESSNYTLNRFLEALKLSRLDDAMSYISKNYLDRVDISEVYRAFAEEYELCANYVVKTSFNESPKNCVASTFLMVERNEKKTKVFNIYMLNEPDRYGKWKIYSIEQE